MRGRAKAEIYFICGRDTDGLFLWRSGGTTGVWRRWSARGNPSTWRTVETKRPGEVRALFFKQKGKLTKYLIQVKVSYPASPPALGSEKGCPDWARDPGGGLQKLTECFRCFASLYRIY